MSRLALASALLVVAIGFACVQRALPPVEVEPLPRALSYLEDVKPVLDSRCVVCHSCYNSACQLQLGSIEGVERGGSKLKVYDSTRLVPAAPTRLFIDARSAAEWRQKGFHSVTESSAEGPYNDSLMLQMITQKLREPEVTGMYRAEADDLACAANPDELGAFLRRHPNRGMPFGFPPLPQEEYAILATWLQRGANGPGPEEHARLTVPSAPAAAAIARWEDFLNESDAKHAMTARYLYEHFFLAHIVFSEADETQFFRLVRSRTPPGEPVSEIPTRRPYDDPGAARFWYRFQRIHETLVHKTHMVMEFTPERMARFQELFIEPVWIEAPHVVPLDDRAGANPFLIYAQIPPTSRYRFLLDHSFFLIQTLMQGPVCKGQVALNVIHDHFWVFFLDPEADQTIQDPDFLIEQADNLRLPNEQGSDAQVLQSFSDAYRRRYEAFYTAKVAHYEELDPEGPDLDEIWRGRVASDSPVLTVYRHFDSASLHHGALGTLPRTLWVMDYSQFERIYYALVAGFDVFGNLSHQVNVRRYMDYLRMEGELNFLAFLPKENRLPTLKEWYVGDRAIQDVNPDEVLMDWSTRIPFQTEDPKRELVEMLIDDHILKSTGIGFDDVNYRRADHVFPAMPTSFDTAEEILDGFRALTKPGTSLIRHIASFDVNLLYVRFRDFEDEDHFVSIVINRWHDNVNSMFGEQDRLDPSKDYLDFHLGSIGSYPNYFFDVAVKDIGDFFDLLDNFDDSPEYVDKVRKYGLDRSDPRFWETYDWFQARLDEADPMRAGLYDLNRYYPDADDGR